uniref:VWFA domain-containing protein n=1 Tax=Macrostomum lignano TaxID=282301 RepID=A0A1I8FPP1_9PLAT
LQEAWTTFRSADSATTASSNASSSPYVEVRGPSYELADIPPFTGVHDVNDDLTAMSPGEIANGLKYSSEKLKFRAVRRTAIMFGAPIPGFRTFYSGCGIGEVQQRGGYHLGAPAAPSTRMWNIFAPLSYDVWLAAARCPVHRCLLHLPCFAYFSRSRLESRSKLLVCGQRSGFKSTSGPFLAAFCSRARISIVRDEPEKHFGVLVVSHRHFACRVHRKPDRLPDRVRDAASNQNPGRCGSPTSITKSWSPREPTYTRKSCSTRPAYYELRKQMKVVDSMPICSQTVAVDSNPYQVCIVDQNINIHFYNAYCNKVYIADQTFNAYSLGVAFPKRLLPCLPSASYFRTDFLNYPNPRSLEKSQDSGLSQWLEYKYFPRSNAECVVSAVTAEADPSPSRASLELSSSQAGCTFELIPELRRQAPTAESMNNFLPPLLLLLLLLAQPSPLRCSTFKVCIVIEDTTISAETVNLAVTRAEVGLSGIIGVGGCALMESLQKLANSDPADYCYTERLLAALPPSPSLNSSAPETTSQLLRAAVEALRFHLAPTVAIFYDRFQSLPLLEALPERPLSQRISVMAFQLDEGKNLSEILTVLIKGQARNATLLQQNYHWLLLSFGLSLSSLNPSPQP